MSNIIKFPEPLINGISKSKYLICNKIADDGNDENSPLGIFYRKHFLLIKELHAICDECRNAYEKEALLDFYVQLADPNDPDIKSLFHTIRIDVTVPEEI